MAKREISEMFVIENGVVIEGEVKVLVTVSQGKGVDRVEFCKDMPHFLDYAGVKIEDLIDSAAANDVVSLQNQVWRGLGAGVKQDEGKATKMAEFYARERTRTAPDPVAAVLKKEMTAADLADLIAKLQAKQNA
jgi:hypothetical protein